MEEFKFTLSKEKFIEAYGNDDDVKEVDDTIYDAIPVSDDVYLVRWETEDGWEGLEYSKEEVETFIKDGFWVK